MTNRKDRAETMDPTEDRSISRSLVGLARGRDVHITRAAALFSSPSRDMSIVNGGCGPALVNGKLTIHNGGCGPVIANGGLSITNGGCGPVVANGDVSIDRGGTQSIIASGSARVGSKAFVGVLASPNVTVEEGGRVLLSGPLALAAGIGLGIAIGALGRRFAPRRDEPTVEDLGVGL
jgi:hypothetical protein